MFSHVFWGFIHLQQKWYFGLQGPGSSSVVPTRVAFSFDTARSCDLVEGMVGRWPSPNSDLTWVLLGGPLFQHPKKHEKTLQDLAAKNGIMTCIDGLPNVLECSVDRKANRKITPLISLLTVNDDTSSVQPCCGARKAWLERQVMAFDRRVDHLGWGFLLFWCFIVW